MYVVKKTQNPFEVLFENKARRGAPGQGQRLNNLMSVVFVLAEPAAIFSPPFFLSQGHAALLTLGVEHAVP